MAQKSNLYWQPSQHLGAGYALRHAAPQLVGRLPHLKRPRSSGWGKAFRAVARMGKVGLAPKPPGLSVKPPQPVIPRQGGALPSVPPAGASLPSPLQGGLLARPKPLVAGLTAPPKSGLPKLPGLPTLP